MTKLDSILSFIKISNSVKYLFAILFFVLPWFMFGQSYKTAAGFRVGKDIGLSISQRIIPKKTIDLYHEPGLFSERNSTGLIFKQHFPIITKRLNFFGGIGGYYTTQTLPTLADEPALNINSSGILMAGGIDFTVGKINLGFDIMPGIRFFGNDTKGRITSSSAITLRYVIVPQKNKTKTFLSSLKKGKKKKR